ncbi:hypothetical protein JOE57_002071 [Microlunatus panaciterrae]|uniref:Uncharacterized protein n=1 Tax=Microlunatus panaciterrae TaxID=400768 RepID=A0ABS2RJH0_9ACTN|nr:hypothetical protein [Microlunatus panaciterrae]
MITFTNSPVGAEAALPAAAALVEDLSGTVSGIVRR